jgi:LAO/AO transport system kinase
MHPLINKVVHGDKRAVARAMTVIENDRIDKRELLEGLYPYAGRAHIVGFTGSPGAGKSTLVDQVIATLRLDGKRVGVLAVDPSSPFTGGALLGDRVRMLRHSDDPGVYIRSMGTRGSVGGLAKSSREMLYALEAYGCDVILLETVGVGQSELDVMAVADTVVLILTPGAGDHVQTAKAGIMEIADAFVINKCDLPGADALVREVQLMLHEKPGYREDWAPPVLRTCATQAEGVDKLWQAIERHRQHIVQHEHWHARRRQRHREETLRLLESAFHQYVQTRAAKDETWSDVLNHDLQYDPYTAMERLLKDLPWLHLRSDMDGVL